MINKICVYSDVGAWRLSGDLESDLERKLRRGGREDGKKEGVKEEQFNKMVGYADTRPLKKSFADLDHPYHNRVSIMVRAGTAR